jgi:hypothetical protein
MHALNDLKAKPPRQETVVLSAVQESPAGETRPRWSRDGPGDGRRQPFLRALLPALAAWGA